MTCSHGAASGQHGGENNTDRLRPPKPHNNTPNFNSLSVRFSSWLIYINLIVSFFFINYWTVNRSIKELLVLNTSAIYCVRARRIISVTEYTMLFVYRGIDLEVTAFKIIRLLITALELGKLFSTFVIIFFYFMDATFTFSVLDTTKIYVFLFTGRICSRVKWNINLKSSDYS